MDLTYKKFNQYSYDEYDPFPREAIINKLEYFKGNLVWQLRKRS